MKHINHWLAAALILVVLGLSACASKPAPAEKVQPFHLEEVDGSDLKRVILTKEAAQRIDLQTVTVNGRIIPYAAVIYDTSGKTWVYISPTPLTFVRQSIVIDYIEDNRAILSDGPESNTSIVTVGVAELYGAETGVSK